MRTAVTSPETSPETLLSSTAELEHFAYMAAHDLQEPLRTVTGYLQLVLQRYGSAMDPHALELLTLAAEGAVRMQDLVESAYLAACGSPGAGAPHMTSSAEALSAAVANLRQAIEHSHARIVSGKLPAVLADPAQLIRIFQNLLANAIRHNCGGSPEISIHCQERPRDWLFRIADNGPGFTGPLVPGLGLQICARIAARHGGRLWAAPAASGVVLCFTLAKV